MATSEARKRRYLEQQRAAAKQAQPSAPAAKERPLKAVPKPESTAPAREEINFLLPPGGLMGGNMIEKKKSVIFPGPLNAHVVQFQAAYQGQRYKVQNATLALWRVLLEERHQMVQEALAEQARTGVPCMPRTGPFQQAFEKQLDRMDAEASGDIFDES
jgi:hypothetical protein